MQEIFEGYDQWLVEQDAQIDLDQMFAEMEPRPMRFYDYYDHRIIDIDQDSITYWSLDSIATYPLTPHQRQSDIQTYSHICRDRRKPGRKPNWLARLENAIAFDTIQPGEAIVVEFAD